jgi:hypothetical protein
MENLALLLFSTSAQLICRMRLKCVALTVTGSFLKVGMLW